MNISTSEKPIKSAYIYPMANATNGGESHSESNIRNSLLNLLSYSAAFSKDDFRIVHSSYQVGSTSNQIPVLDDSRDTDAGSNGTLYLAISPGKGNCNSYFVECGEFGSYIMDESGTQDNSIAVPLNLSRYAEYLPVNDSNAIITCDFDLGLYLCINYANNIADGINYKLVLNKVYNYTANDKSYIPNTEYEKVYSEQYEPQGFNDIGILIGTMTVHYDRGSYTTTGSFRSNENKTRCIDLDRLGSSRGLVEDLGAILNRLRQLNVFGGSFYVSNTLKAKNGLNSDIGSTGVVEDFGGDYRLKLSCDTQGTKSECVISGYISIVDSNNNDELVSKILDFIAKVNDGDKNNAEFTLCFNDIDVNYIRCNLIESSRLNVSDLSVSSITIHGNKITFSGNAEILYNGEKIIFNKPILADKVYGAVWM